MPSNPSRKTGRAAASRALPSKPSSPPGPCVLDGVRCAEERRCGIHQVQAAAVRPSEPPPAETPPSADRKAWIADALRAYDAEVERLAGGDVADPAVGLSVRPVRPAPAFEGPAKEVGPDAPRALGRGIYGFEARGVTDPSVTWTTRVRVVRHAGGGTDVRIAAFSSDGQVIPWIDAKLLRSG